MTWLAARCKLRLFEMVAVPHYLNALGRTDMCL